MKKIFTLILAATAISATAQTTGEMIIDDDFSWLNVPAIASSPNLSISTVNGVSDNAAYKFVKEHLEAKGLTKHGWEQGVFDLNAEHTQRLAPEPGVEPENFFDHPYNSIWMRPGFFKIGYGGFGGAIVSPAFEKLGDRTADVEVTLQLCAASAAATGVRDNNNVYVGLWDNSDGEVVDADHEEMANQWFYPCKALKVTNYQQSEAKEYGDAYDEWDKSRSLYTVKVSGATANTRLYIFFGTYGSGQKQHTTPTEIEEEINGVTKTWGFKPTSNRMGFKGCWVKVLKVTSGIDEIEADTNAPAEYFNLQGIRVANPEKGHIYIRRQGATATKIIM